MSKYLFSAYGIVERVQMIKLEKEYTSFILVHFKDTNSVANVMRNKDHIIISECKFNVSEPKVSHDSSLMMNLNDGKNLVFYFIFRIKIDQKVISENRTIKSSNIKLISYDQA